MKQIIEIPSTVIFQIRSNDPSTKPILIEHGDEISIEWDSEDTEELAGLLSALADAIETEGEEEDE